VSPRSPRPPSCPPRRVSGQYHPLCGDSCPAMCRDPRGNLPRCPPEVCFPSSPDFRRRSPSRALWGISLCGQSRSGLPSRRGARSATLVGFFFALFPCPRPFAHLPHSLLPAGSETQGNRVCAMQEAPKAQAEAGLKTGKILFSSQRIDRTT